MTRGVLRVGFAGFLRRLETATGEKGEKNLISSSSYYELAEPSYLHTNNVGRYSAAAAAASGRAWPRLLEARAAKI